MNKFPDTFVSTAVSIKISKNRGDKLSQDRKNLRQEIIDAFGKLTTYFTEVSYTFTSNCTDDELHESYKKIKNELEDPKRGFLCHGVIKGKTVHMLIAVHKPHRSDPKWNQALKAFIDRHTTYKKIKSGRKSGKSTARSSRASSRAHSPQRQDVPPIHFDGISQASSGELQYEIGNMILGGGGGSGSGGDDEKT
jgi:hypothetical protein